MLFQSKSPNAPWTCFIIHREALKRPALHTGNFITSRPLLIFFTKAMFDDSLVLIKLSCRISSNCDIKDLFFIKEVKM